MPILQKSTYSAPKFLPTGHLQTIYPYFFRKVPDLSYDRWRIETADGDFLDLDFSSAQTPDSKKLIVLSHGLEGNSQSQYVKGMARHFNKLGYDALAWNMRSCSGEMNLKPYFYHSGQIEDLNAVIHSALEKKDYQEICLVGFSLGAGLTAMYLGTQGKNLLKQIKSSVLFSTPCCLRSSGEELSKKRHLFYAETFLSTMRKKVIEKDRTMGLPMLDLTDLHKVKTFRDFDDRVTAPLIGLASALDYYRHFSCKPYLTGIECPTLIINAKNDPFLGVECYPIREAFKNPALFLEMPQGGGHLGFSSTNQQLYWSEFRAQKFIFEHAG